MKIVTGKTPKSRAAVAANGHATFPGDGVEKEHRGEGGADADEERAQGPAEEHAGEGEVRGEAERIGRHEARAGGFGDEAEGLELRRRAHREAREVALGRGEMAAGEQLGGVEIAGGIGTAGDRGKIEAEEHRITQQHHGGEPSKPARSGSGGGVRI
jgi:hypothetical protein